MNVGGVYKIINRLNGKYYVGSSNRIQRRLCEHRRKLTHNIHDNPHLQSAWNKYGEFNFEFTALEESQTPKVLEQQYLDVAKNEPNKCYNTSFIVDNPPRLTGEREILRRLRIRESINRVYREHPEIKNVLRERSLLRFQSESSRMELSEQVKDAMKNPAILEKLRISKRDKTPYHFQNRVTGKAFTGTRLEFQEKYSFKKGSIDHLLDGKRKSHFDWILVNPK